MSDMRDRGELTTSPVETPAESRRALDPERNTAYPDTQYGLGSDTRRMQWVSAAQSLLGAWLVAAPFAVGYTAARTVSLNEYVVGGVLAFLAFLRFTMPLRMAQLAWLEFVLSGWLVCSAFVLGYPIGFDRAAPYWTLVIGGALGLLLAAWSSVLVEQSLTPRRRR